MSELYLQPKDDGLVMRNSHTYAKDKLRILTGYIARFTTAMREKWGALCFIDLFAGPGKNVFESSEDVMLGSPLIALTSRYPFSYYRFVEMGDEEYQALKKRVSVSEHKDRVKIIQGNCNTSVDNIIADINDTDKRLRTEKQKPSLNLAFLDPEGLELEWQTVNKLGRMQKMDLIINFSTSGFTRNVDQMLDTGNTQPLDRFFGTPDWKTIYQSVANKDKTHVRRAMLDYYKQRLGALGYIIHPDERVFKISNNRQIYTLMFASKHKLGNKFWSDAIQEVSQPPLL